MMNIIESAIITIIISFISGLLLEYYKNLSPRILCTVGNGILIEMNNKKNCSYILTVRNISNKIIHEITLNIQSPQNNLKIGHAKITKGLKFDSSIKNNNLVVDIPFLSKDDEFSITLYIEKEYGVYNKPVVIIRSPEKFREVDSVEQKGVFALLFNMPKNINKIVSKKMKKNKTIVPSKKGDFARDTNKTPGTKKAINDKKREILRRNKKFSKNKIAIIIIVSIISVMSGWWLGKIFLGGTPTKAQTPSIEINDNKQSTDQAGSTGGATKNTDSKSSTGGPAKNTGSKSSTSGITKNTGTKSSTDGTNENISAKTSTDEKAATDGATKNADTKTSADVTTGNPDTKTSTDGKTKNPDTKAATDGKTKNPDIKTPTGGVNGNPGN